jgi:ketosteroid isomerase-like protein
VISWLARIWIRRLFSALQRGDIKPMLSTFAKDAVFRFPGDSSWSGVYRGRREIERWLRRFAGVQMQFEVRDVAVGGPPWNMSIFTRFTDSWTAPDGTVVYENEGVLFDRAKWMKIVYHEACEDTMRVAPLDDYLAAQGDELAMAAVATRAK